MISWFSRNRTSLCPSREIALRATRHLNRIQKRNLFSEDPGTMKAAEGRWYEAMIYEMVLDLCQNSDNIHGVAGKGADARGRKPTIGLGQNGLLHSRSGDIKIRGNGQDLAEIDLLMMGSDGSIAFGEIVTSPANIREIEDEIEYKKKLLGFLFGQEKVQFILFSSVDISRMATVRRILKDPDNAFIATNSCEEIRNLLNPQEIWQWSEKPFNSPKLLPIRDFLAVRSFDYKQLHDQKRKEVLDILLNDGGKAKVKPSRERWSPVKKILIGALYPNAVRILTPRVVFRIGDRRLTGKEIEIGFAKVVLAINIPEGEPIFYMKIRGKKEYLKMVRQKDGTFRCESARTRKMLGFFLWLESIQPTIGTAVTQKILSSVVFIPPPATDRHHRR
ncbi:MAG: hypothetical protein LUP99_04425 [Methanomicrobiales archaeon]|nr:hypothetical protein [Methanomicrobiales archaeon]